MNEQEIIIASTLVDKQGEKLSRQVLEQLAQSANEHYIPINIEHDPRIPPVGRIISSSVRERDDGEYEAIARLQMFDNSFSELNLADNREMIIRKIPINSIVISYGWGHKNNPADMDNIDGISKILNHPPSYEAKKSLDPINIISLTFAFMVGGFFSGLFNKIGADAWDTIKIKLKPLISKAEHRKGDQLLIFRNITEVNNNPVEVEVILTNPSEQLISQFISTDIKNLDNILPALLQDQTDIRRIVFEYKDSQLTLSFAVRKDCVPIQPNLK